MYKIFGLTALYSHRRRFLSASLLIIPSSLRRKIIKGRKPHFPARIIVVIAMNIVFLSASKKSCQRRVESEIETLVGESNRRISSMGVREGTSLASVLRSDVPLQLVAQLSWWMMRVRSCLEILHQMLERCSSGEVHQASARLLFNNFKISKGEILLPILL